METIYEFIKDKISENASISVEMLRTEILCKFGNNPLTYDEGFLIDKNVFDKGGYFTTLLDEFPSEGDVINSDNDFVTNVGLFTYDVMYG